MASAPKPIILSTAGAIPIKNEKGQLTMEKVKVARYITGKRPEYAPYSSDEEEEDEGVVFPNKLTNQGPVVDYENEVDDDRLDDRRVRRLLEAKREREGERHRRGSYDDDDDEEEEEEEDDRKSRLRQHRRQAELEGAYDEDTRRPEMGESSEDEDLSDDEIERRREEMRLKLLTQKKEEEELMEVGEESAEEDEQQKDREESEYEEYTDSEEDEDGPRLKPVFVRKKDRITIQEREKELQKSKDQEYEAKKLANERRQQTLRMVEAEIKRDMETKVNEDDLDGMNSNDETEEEQYEAWKVRELKRIKRDRDEREAHEREKQEVGRVRNMTEEERRQEMKLNPKLVTNKAAKGKYKFLQKYYHRGVFYLDKEDTVLKRDYTAPTLEDHFNKTILPKVMQVKNFGRSGRTKYTHLVDQDTTQFDSPWIADTAMNLKFYTNRGGGVKPGTDKSKQ